MSHSYKELSSSDELFKGTELFIQGNDLFVYKESSYSYTRKWVSHIKLFIQGNKPFIHGSELFIWEKECFRNELFVYMGVVDSRKCVVQMGYSHANFHTRKWVIHIRGNELYIRRKRFFIQGNELFNELLIPGTEIFIQVFQTRRLDLHMQRHESYIHTRTWVIHMSYSCKGKGYDLFIYKEMSYSYEEISYS